VTTLLRPIIAALGLLLVAAGLILRPFDWGLLAPRALDSLLLAAAVLAIAATAARLLRVPTWPTLLLAGLVLPALVFAGAAPVLATLLVLAGGLAVGTLLARDGDGLHGARWIAGLGLLAALLGWLLPLPVHFAPVWASVLGLACWWRREAMARDLRALALELRTATDAAPRAAAALALVVAVSAAPAWLPAMMQDDLTYHLGLGWQLMEHGQARFNVGSQAWALAAWSTDCLHALVMLLAGGESHGPLNAFWLLAAALGVRSLAAGLGLGPRQAWLCAMLYASLPLASSLTHSLQIKAATPAVVAALALVLQRAQPGPRALLLVAALAGFLLGGKSINALALVPFLAWLLIAWRGRMPWRALAPAIGLGLFAGVSSYVYSWTLTGNPVLPLYNHLFESPWFPVNFDDLDQVRSVWVAPLGWNFPWRLVFDTGLFQTALPGGAGLLPLALLGGVALALADARLRLPMAVAVAAFMLLLVMAPLLRYAHPLLALAVPVAAAGFLGREGTSRWREAALAVLVLLQLALIPSSYWLLSNGALRQLVLEGHDAVLAANVPERLASGDFRRLAKDDDRLLFADRRRAYAAELPGRAFGVNWHNPALAVYKAGNLDQAAQWQRLVTDTGATWLVTREAAALPGLAAFLSANGAERVSRHRQVELYRLAPPWRDWPLVSSGSSQVASVAFDGGQPVLGKARASLACKPVGAQVQVGWALRMDGEVLGSDWSWQPCDGRGRVETFARFSATGQGETLVLTLAPAQPGSGLELGAGSAHLDLRPDWLAGRELASRVADPRCWRDNCIPGKASLAVE